MAVRPTSDMSVPTPTQMRSSRITALAMMPIITWLLERRATDGALEGNGLFMLGGPIGVR